MKRILMALACACISGLVALSAFAGDQRQGRQMTVEQMQAQVVEARANHRDVTVRLKNGGSITGEIQEITANGFSLNQTKDGRIVWADYADAQAIKRVNPVKQGFKVFGWVVLGAAVIGALWGLTAWVAVLIANQ